MKRKIFFILLVAGLSLKAQQPSTNAAPSLSNPAVAAPLHIDPQLRQFDFQTQEAKGATGTAEPKAIPDFRLEQAELKPMLTRSISCSGVIVDLAIGREVTEPFGLRRPLDPTLEFKNILFHVQNERPRGIVLFSLNF